MWFIRILQYLTNLIKAGEETAITFVSTVIPWATPLLPAFIMFKHVTNPNELGYPQWVGWCVGAIVEGIGLSSMYRSFQFFEHNRKYKDSQKKSPTYIPVSMYVFYLTVVLSVNVIMDWQAGVQWSHILVIGLISSLSVPAGTLIAVTAVHDERVSEHKADLAQKRAERAAQRMPAEQQKKEDRPANPASAHKAELLFILEQYLEQGVKLPGVKELCDVVKVEYENNKGYVSTLRKDFINAHPEIPQELVQ